MLCIGIFLKTEDCEVGSSHISVNRGIIPVKSVNYSNLIVRFGSTDTCFLASLKNGLVSKVHQILHNIAFCSARYLTPVQGYYTIHSDVTPLRNYALQNV